MSDAFDLDERPTRPAATATAKTRTSRWRAVAGTALERGFGRLSVGEFDQGNLPDESGTRVVAARAESEAQAESEARSESETLPAPEPREEPAPAPPAEAAPEEPPPAARSLGPRGTVRMQVPGLRGPTGTVRMAPVRAARRIALARLPWVAISSFALLSVALLVEIPRANGAVAVAPANVAEQTPSDVVGPSDPPQPPADFVLPDEPAAQPAVVEGAPRQNDATAAQAPHKHSRPWWKHGGRAHRAHGSNVF